MSIGFECMKCKRHTKDIKCIAKNTAVRGSKKIGVCIECYNKRQKWLKSRKLV